VSRRQLSDNESLAVVPVFGVDQRGAAIFAGAVAGGRVGSGRVPIDAHDSPWHGWTQSPQRFRGAGFLGAARPKDPVPETLEQGRSAAVLTPTEQILEQRAAAGRFG
jgi:hypothetical protein